MEAKYPIGAKVLCLLGTKSFIGKITTIQLGHGYKEPHYIVENHEDIPYPQSMIEGSGVYGFPESHIIRRIE